MPFASEAQRKYLWAKEPEVARKWAHEAKSAGKKKSAAPKTKRRSFKKHGK